MKVVSNVGTYFALVVITLTYIYQNMASLQSAAKAATL